MRRWDRWLKLLLAGAFLTLALGAGYEGFGAGSVGPEVLAQFAPPALPTAIEEQIQQLLDVRAIQGGALTDDGAMIVEWSVTGSTQLWRLDGPGRFPVQLTAGKANARLFGLSRDGQEIFFTRDRGGREYPGLYRMPIGGGQARTIRAQEGVQVRPHSLSRDGRFLYYSASDVTPDSYAVYRYDLQAETSVRLPLPPGLWAAGAEREGSLLLELERGSLWSEWYLLPGADGQPGPLTSLMGKESPGDWAVSFDAHSDARGGTAPGGSPGFLVRTDTRSGFHSLYRWTPGSDFTPVYDGPQDVEGYMQDEQGSRLLITVNEGGYLRPRALDARTLAPLPLPGFPQGDTVYWGSTSRDGRRTLVLHESSDRPMSLGVWDWKRRRLEPWLTGSVPEFDISRVPPAAVAHYPARDGTPIPMIVRRPAGCAPAGSAAAPAGSAAAPAARPCPVIAIFHGGPEGQSRPRFSPIFQMWLDAGFVVVLPNVRGSTGYGRDWSHADDGAGRLSVITDIEDLATFIRKEWQVGGAAPFIGVMGSSYGGYTAMMAMTRFAGAYDAGISTVGISDLESFLRNTAPYRRLLRINEYGDPALIPDAIRQLSPMHWVGQARDPLLLIQGVNDPRVPVGEALQMYDAYRARAPASLILMPDQGHGASDRAGQVIQYGSQYRFFLEQRDAFDRRAARSDPPPRPEAPQVIPQALPKVQ